MRIVDWNIEWMNDWFVGGGNVAFREDNPRKGITDVAALCTRVANVVKGLNPDVLTIQEGPSDIREMALFVENYLTDNQGESLLAWMVVLKRFMHSLKKEVNSKILSFPQTT